MFGAGSRVGAANDTSQPVSDLADAKAKEVPWVVFLLFVFVFVAAILPIVIITHPIQIDLPQHLARHYIASTIERSDHLSRFYSFEWQIIPYLAGDVLHQVLARYAPIYDAGRIALGIVFLLWLTAALLLHRVLWGTFSAWPLLSVLFFYNANVGWGFENYVLGSALAVLLFVAWVAWQPARLSVKAFIFTGLATLLYLMHIFAFGVFGLLYLTYELGRNWDLLLRNLVLGLGRLTIIGLPIVPGTLLFITLVLLSTEYATDSRTIFGGIPQRIGVLTGALSARFYDLQIDRIVFGCLFFLFLWGLLTKRLSFHPTMKLVLIVFGALCLIIPYKSAGVTFTHHRMPFIFFMLLIASSRWEAVRPTVYWVTASAVVAMILARSVMIIDYWKPHDIEMKELVQSFQKLERGATLLPVWNGVRGEMNHWYSSAYAVIERDAFVPILFSAVTLLDIQPEFRRINGADQGISKINRVQGDLDSFATAIEAANSGTDPGSDRHLEVFQGWWPSFSHVLVVDREKTGNPSPEHLELIHDGSYYAIYRNLDFESQPEGPSGGRVTDN
ncbi:MAG: hypothetical protein AAF495_00125 [Pseudomonadota bacterium]